MVNQTGSRIFAFTALDSIPVLCGIGHLAYVIGMFLLFPHAPWWVMGILGAIYAMSISWNINGVSHNFIHNPYFRSPILNRLFSLVESLAIGFSQTFYHYVHLRHHMGNNDRQDETGDTIDWLSYYRYGKNGEPENVWAFTFLSYFRDDPMVTYREIKTRSKADAAWGAFEVACFIAMVIAGFVLNWKFMLFLIPFNYLGNCLSSLNGYYEHFGGNPDLPIAWGVSTYGRFYNWIWFNNGYHAEHHFRPRMHWAKMKDFRREIQAEQARNGVYVIQNAHALGFLENHHRNEAFLNPYQQLSLVQEG